MTSSLLATRAIVRVSPSAAPEGEPREDVAAFLQGLLTNDVTGDLPVYAGLLTAQGKTKFDMIVWPGSDGSILLDCEAEAADELVKRLSLYRLRRKIDIARDDTLGIHWQPFPGDGGAADPRLGALGQRWIAPIDADNEQKSDAAADDAYLAHRLSLGVAEGRAELEDILWLETNAAELNGVSFSKGCFIGQENTARMNWRGKVNRRLIVVPLDRSDETRRKIAYPDLGLAIDHLRVGDIGADLVPSWLDLPTPV